jgi:uncharacterized membrane protein
MRRLGWLPLLFFLILVVMLPFIFGKLFTSTLVKLKLEPTTALLVVIGIFMGSAINIPVKRISRTKSVPVDPLTFFGLSEWWPLPQQVPRETVIAVNVGGCIILLTLAICEMAHVVTAGLRPLSGLLLAIFLNMMACYWVAKPVKGIGIAMPGLFPPLLATICALALVPDQAPPVAFVAGVLGPFIGADLLHLRDIEKTPSASPASAVPVRSMGSYSSALLRLIWRKSIVTS